MPSRLNLLLEEQLKNDFAEIDHMVLVDYQGLNSEKMAEFRDELREKGLHMEVVKNSIWKAAVKDAPAKLLVEDPEGALGDDDPLKGPTGVITGGESAIDCARFAVEWLKKNPETIALKAALMGEEVFPSAQVVALSKLPSRKELLAKMAATVQAPTQKLAATVQAGYARVLWGMQALADKLEG